MHVWFYVCSLYLLHIACLLNHDNEIEYHFLLPSSSLLLSSLSTLSSGLQSRVQVSAALYQTQTVSLQVASSFLTAAQFDVNLYESTDDSILTSLTPAIRSYIYVHSPYNTTVYA